MSLIFPDFQNIVVIDEVTKSFELSINNSDAVIGRKTESIGDWSALNTSHPNVDLCIGFNPRLADCQELRLLKFSVEQSQYFGTVVVPANNDSTLGRQLFAPYRTCLEIAHLIEHFDQRHKTNLKPKAHGSPLLNPSKDITIPQSRLPKGKLPKWIVGYPSVGYAQLLQYVKDNHVSSNESVTLACPEPQKDVIEFCENRGWNYVKSKNLRGCEDQCVILLD